MEAIVVYAAVFLTAGVVLGVAIGKHLEAR